MSFAVPGHEHNEDNYACAGDDFHRLTMDRAETLWRGAGAKSSNLMCCLGVTHQHPENITPAQSAKRFSTILPHADSARPHPERSHAVSLETAESKHLGDHRSVRGRGGYPPPAPAWALELTDGSIGREIRPQGSEAADSLAVYTQAPVPWRCMQ